MHSSASSTRSTSALLRIRIVSIPRQTARGAPVNLKGVGQNGARPVRQVKLQPQSEYRRIGKRLADVGGRAVASVRFQIGVVDQIDPPAQPGRRQGTTGG